jgi:hypothetical protein
VFFPSQIRKIKFAISPYLGDFPQFDFSNFPRSGEFLQSQVFPDWITWLDNFNIPDQEAQRNNIRNSPGWEKENKEHRVNIKFVDV